MAQESSIEWTERTWNPIRGCSKISPGCENCYAMFTASLFIGPGQPYEGLAKRKPTNWTGQLRLVEDKLYEPLRRRKPTTYFVNSMSDLFHEKVPDEWIDRIMAVMAITPQHTYQVLTKRAERMRNYFDKSHRLADVYGPLDNVWLGVSVENRDVLEDRVQNLAHTPAAVKFLSCEPLLESLWPDLGFWLSPPCDGGDEACEVGDCDCPTKPAVDWVIVGGESAQGSRCRPCDMAWIREIVEGCRAAYVPVFVKQLGSRPFLGESDYGVKNVALKTVDKKGGDPAEWPERLRIRQFPRALEAV